MQVILSVYLSFDIEWVQYTADTAAWYHQGKFSTLYRDQHFHEEKFMARDDLILQGLGKTCLSEVLQTKS